METASFRLDRSLTTLLFHPLQRLGAGRGVPRLPVLMYHGICEDPQSGVHSYYKTSTSPAVFRRQMRQLSGAAYKTVDLARAVQLLAEERLPREKNVVITFDDGFENFYTEAFPILQEHHFTATMFLPTAYINDSRRAFKNTRCLTWSEVRRLRKDGITFGSHTVNHPELYKLPFGEIERELRESKTELEQQLSEPVTTFAYPFAFPQADTAFARTFRAVMVNAGYLCCATTELGRVKAGDDPYRLKRLPVNSADDETLLRAKLEGGYDWLARPQALAKELKSWKSIFARGARFKRGAVSDGRFAKASVSGGKCAISNNGATEPV